MNVEAVLNGPRPLKPITTEARHRWRLAPYLFKEKGLSRSQVAELLGVTEGTAANLINGPSEGEIGRRMVTKLRNQSNPMTGVKRLPLGERSHIEAMKVTVNKAPRKSRKDLHKKRAIAYIERVGNTGFTAAQMSEDLGLSLQAVRYTLNSPQVEGIIQIRNLQETNRGGNKCIIWGKSPDWQVVEGAV